MDADLWKRFKMIAILNEMEVSELVEQALREKLERMKQLEQYPEYKEVEGLRVQRSRSKTEQPPQQPQQPQIQTRTQEQKLDELKLGTSKIPLKDLMKSEFPIFLPGVEFPKKRDDLIQIVKNLLIEFQEKYHKKPLMVEHSLRMLQKLDNTKLYKNKEDLSDDLTRVLSKETTLNEEIVLSEPLKMHGCNIITEFKDVKGRAIKKELMEMLNTLDNKMRQSVKERQLATY